MRIQEKLLFQLQEHSDGTLTVRFFDTLDRSEKTVKIDDPQIAAACRAAIRYGAELAQEKVRGALGIVGE
jgi:hypothetical protein